MAITATTPGPVETKLAADLDACPAVRSSRIRAGVAALVRRGRADVLVEVPHDDANPRVLDALAGALASYPEVVACEPRSRAVAVSLRRDWVRRTLVDAVRRDGTRYGWAPPPTTPRRLVTLYSSPNLNKPLHLGHFRQNVFGNAVSALFETQGWDVVHASMNSDWGVHVCHALVGYQRWGHALALGDVDLKGDRAAGQCLVRFHEEVSADRARHGIAASIDTPLEIEARHLLRRLDAGDADALRLLRRLTRWVATSFTETYERIGSRFAVEIAESAELERSRRHIERALARGICARRADGSIYMDLTDVGLWEVTLVRGDGTTTALAQHIGAHDALFEVTRCDRMLMIFGPDWKLMHEASREIYRRLGVSWAADFEGMNHALVSLPGGRMRSRSGTVLGADDALDRFARRLAAEPQGGPGAVTRTDPAALAAALLTWAFLRVPHTKDVVYDEEAVWQTTAPALWSVLHATNGRGQAPRRRGAGEHLRTSEDPVGMVLALVNDFPRLVMTASRKREPAYVTRYASNLADAVHACAAQDLDDQLRDTAAQVLRNALGLLNIQCAGSDGAGVENEREPAVAAR